MASLWGSKNADEDERPSTRDGESSSQAPPARSSHEADERTRLLPPSQDGYLSPDDPAVYIFIPIYRKKF